MGKAVLILLALLGWLVYYAGGPGAAGRSPRSTARAFTRALAAQDCAARIERQYADVAGARGLCSEPVQIGLRAVTRFMVTYNDGRTAIVDCLYGFT